MDKYPPPPAVFVCSVLNNDYLWETPWLVRVCWFPVEEWQRERGEDKRHRGVWDCSALQVQERVSRVSRSVMSSFNISELMIYLIIFLRVLFGLSRVEDTHSFSPV